MTTRETKEFSFKLASSSDEGTFRGYASVWDELDLQGDKVMRGAFKKTLAEHKTFPVLWSHDPREPLGTITAVEDAWGLAVEGQLDMNVTRAVEIRSLMKTGAVRGLSIGYETLKSDWEKGTGARLLKEIKLHEISPCVFPAAPSARVAEVKTTEDEKRKVIEMIDRFMRL